MKKAAVIAGTYFSNANGEKRAEIIRKHCKVGLPIILKREPNNSHDADAIAVMLIISGLFGRKLKQIGYIKASSADRLADKMDAGANFAAVVKSFSARPSDDSPRVTIEFE